MAYAAVTSLSQTIGIVLIYHDDYTFPEFKDQIRSLHKHMIFFESFLDDFPDRANNWDETIREVADRAEEIVELLLSDSLLESKSTVGSSRSKLEKGKYKVDRHYDFHELERVSEEMESIASRLKGKRAEATGGSDEELMGIISRIRGGSSELETIAIVGMGGMGKAALTRNAYNHPLIVEHFEIRVWSTISNTSLKKTKEGLFRYLHGRRYLVVLDGKMTVNAFRKLSYELPRDGNGSRIVLITTSFELARAANHTYKMRLLDEDKTWNVVREKIFKGDPCPPRLEYFGKMIARNCKGHPLSIEVVCGILAAADQTEATWKDVSENMNITDSGDHGDELLGVLSLSYTYLPHHLRPCFLYLACFPQVHEIHVSKLIKLWVAEGFLKESECKSFEETGEEHVEDLVRRNLISVSKRKSNGRIKSIAIYDVMRDLCLRQAQIDNFIHHVPRNPNVMKLGSCRRVSSSVYGNYFRECVSGSNIRTLMINLHSSELVYIFTWRIRNVRLLRILDLSNAYPFDLPEEVFELFHLRYLAFHFGFSISRAISNLQNLQTLIIFPRKQMSAEKFGKLPDGIWRMPQLRHLILSRFKLPSHQIRATSALENLQSLSIVDFICSRKNLKMIPNLKKLALLCTKKTRDVVQDYELHNLIYLKKLENLKIEINWSSSGETHKMMSFAFPPTLKKLSLIGLGFVWEDMNIVGLLPNLQVLKLRNHACIGETWETSEGGFSQLVYLLIEESNLENWITEARHFPKLKCLMLHSCSSLLKVANDMGNIPTLEIIESETVSVEVSESDSEGSTKFWR